MFSCHIDTYILFFLKWSVIFLFEYQIFEGKKNCDIHNKCTCISKGGSGTGTPDARPPVWKKILVCFGKFWLHKMHYTYSHHAMNVYNMHFILYSNHKNIGMCKGASIWKQSPDHNVLDLSCPQFRNSWIHHSDA